LAKYSQFGNPYPASVKRDFGLAEFLKKFTAFLNSKKTFYITGRVRALRDQGKIIFCDLEDGSGRAQVILSEKELKNFETIKAALDIGDFLEIQGSTFKTQRGEKSILAKSGRIITKSLRPLPTDWYGLEDIETKLRKRYLDLILNPETKAIFVKKSVFWASARNYLNNSGFLEVETPVLESIPGGAEAEPFKTHHNALDADFYLRISLELPLKKLLVGGFEKVFEIGRIFRNEGIDREHLQDYTQMECYWAYADYEDMMKFVEGLYKTIIKKTFGLFKIKSGDKVIDWGKKWPKVEYYGIFKKNTGIDLASAGIEELRRKVESLKIETGLDLDKFGKGRLIDSIFKRTVRPELINPCFLVNPPVEVEPLAKRLEKDAGKVARFQVMALGTELGKGFSELNDPIDQRKRLEEQMKLRKMGDKEAQQLDEDFLEALEYGMPPAAGFGMSERLFSVLMDKPIRETVFFPLMRPKGE